MRQYFLQPISLSSHLLPTDLVNYSFKQELIVFCFLSSYCQIQFAPHGRNSFIRFLSCPQREVFAIFHQGKNFFSLLEEFKNCEERKVYFSKEYTNGKEKYLLAVFCLDMAKWEKLSFFFVWNEDSVVALAVFTEIEPDIDKRFFS